jgi:hypothetical protein
MRHIELIKNAVTRIEFKNRLNSKNKFPRSSKAYKNFLKSEMPITNNLAKLDVNHNISPKDSESFTKTHYGDVYNATIE